MAKVTDLMVVDALRDALTKLVEKQQINSRNELIVKSAIDVVQKQAEDAAKRYFRGEVEAYYRNEPGDMLNAVNKVMRALAQAIKENGYPYGLFFRLNEPLDMAQGPIWLDGKDSSVGWGAYFES